ncbi:MAG: hypothetical protein ACI37O_01830 [Candidatus Avelusimicrobium sp.]|uniref:hypothetical protein n=1 Tax=Candidatus Avelusimicrobium sp. TaxID=3048833 RepID=UPI003F08AF0E
MLEHTLLHAGKSLLEAMDNVADENLPSGLADIVKFHAKGATISSLSSAIPGVGAALSGLASASFIWTMYTRINKMLGLKLADNILKTVASGVVTNLAGYAVASFAVGTVLSLIPGLGTVATIALVGSAVYAVTMVSGIVYLKILTNIFNAGKNPDSLSANHLKEIASDVISSMDIKSLFKEAKEEFKEKNEEGEFDKE